VDASLLSVSRRSSRISDRTCLSTEERKYDMCGWKTWRKIGYGRYEIGRIVI
jgi:hypothetical protein